MTGKRSFTFFSALSLLVILLCHLQSTNASTQLDCARLSSTDCKTEFGKLFDAGFKHFHLAAYKEILKAYIDAYENVKSHLTRDNPFFNVLAQKIHQLETIIKKLDEEENNLAALLKIVNTAVPTAVIVTDKVEAVAHVKRTIDQLIESENIDETTAKIVAKFAVNISNLWDELKTTLRQDDLKTYADYTEIGTILHEVAYDVEGGPQFLGLAGVRSKIAQTLGVPYLSGIEVIF